MKNSRFTDSQILAILKQHKNQRGRSELFLISQAVIWTPAGNG